MWLNFAFVYMMEAHAADKWPMKWAVEWPEPQSLMERIACAKRCDEDLGLSPIVQLFVDTMDNDFCKTFKAWPAGCYVLTSNRRLLFIGAPETHDVFFDIERLFGFLRTFVGSDLAYPNCNESDHQSSGARLANPSFQAKSCPLFKDDGIMCAETPSPQSACLAGA